MSQQLPKKYKNAPTYLYLRHRVNGELRNLSTEADVFVVLTDNKTKVVFRSGDANHPVENYSDNYKRVYLSSEILDAWRTGTVFGVAGFDNEDNSKDLRNISKFLPLFELTNDPV